MSVEAFIWNYRDGQPIGFAFDAVREILSKQGTVWNSEYGFLRIRFTKPDDFVDVHVGQNAPSTNHVDGIMVSRPIDHPDYLARVLEVMHLGSVMLFYSDETTPIFVKGADTNHYPSELLDQLGVPRFVQTPVDLLHQT